jgi:putative selenate reductase
MIALQERFNLTLIESALTDAEAKAEAMRCVQCTAVCDKCVEVCPNRANFTFLMGPVTWDLPQLVCRDGGLAVDGSSTFRVSQARQILHVDDWCNECDDCQTFCVHEGEPYFDKPRLFLTEEDFLAETDNAFHVDGNAIWRREGGQDLTLVMENGTLQYEDANVRLRLTPEFEVKEMALKAPFEGTLSLQNAAEMAVVFKGIRDSLPFLLV